jgi:LuxR family maltose regulon positive regulatory protein
VIARGNKDFASAIAFGEQALQIVPEVNQNLQTTISTLLSSAILAAGDFNEAESLLHSTRQRVSHSGNSFITFTLLLNASALAVMRAQLHRAYDLNEEALRLTQSKSMERLAFLPKLRLGRIHYFWNQLAKAKEIVATALEQADLEHYTEAVIRGQITLAWIQGAEEQYPQMLHTLAIAEHSAIDHHKHESAEMVKAVRAQSQFWAGEKEAVMSWMKALGWDILNPSQSGTIPNDEAFFLLCQVLIKAEAWQRVQDLLAWRMADSQVQRRDSTILKIHLMQALLHRTQDDLDLAMPALSQALELAMPENYIRPFLDEGRQLLPLLRRIPKTHIVKSFAQKILADQLALPEAVSLLEPMSKQELAILRLMSQGRSNPEIAQQLILAVSTVRWYVKQIFRKLEVHNRTQAASQAQKLNLL